MKHLISTKCIEIDKNPDLNHTYRFEPPETLVRHDNNHKSIRIQHRVKGSCVESQGDKHERVYSEKKGPFNVLDYEQWSCEVKEVYEEGIKIYATDSRHVKNSRYFTMKRSYFESLCKEPFETITEGSMLDWTFKRVKRENGVIIKNEEISVYKRLIIPEWQLQQQIEEEMKELSFLFQNP